jgi:hypothetical protein
MNQKKKFDFNKKIDKDKNYFYLLYALIIE